jgi:hypothetical protein
MWKRGNMYIVLISLADRVLFSRQGAKSGFILRKQTVDQSQRLNMQPENLKGDVIHLFRPNLSSH